MCRAAVSSKGSEAVLVAVNVCSNVSLPTRTYPIHPHSQIEKRCVQTAWRPMIHTFAIECPRRASCLYIPYPPDSPSGFIQVCLHEMITCTVSSKGWGKSFSCCSLGVNDNVTESAVLADTVNSLFRAKPCWLRGPKPPNWGKHTGMPPLH